MEAPPANGERVQILNQMTETHRIADLAAMIAGMTGVEVSFLENPRNEAAQNTLPAIARTLQDMGLKPTLLQEGLLQEVMHVAQRYANRCDRERILCTSRWKS